MMDAPYVDAFVFFLFFFLFFTSNAHGHGAEPHAGKQLNNENL